MSRPTQIASMRLKQKWHAIIATAGTARRRMTGRSGPTVSEPAGRATVAMEAEARGAEGGGSTRERPPSFRTDPAAEAGLQPVRSPVTTPFARDRALDTRHQLLRPLLHPQPRHPPEFADVVGNHGDPIRHGDRRDQEIPLADRATAQCEPEATVTFRRLAIERYDLKGRPRPE